MHLRAEKRWEGTIPQGKSLTKAGAYFRKQSSAENQCPQPLQPAQGLSWSSVTPPTACPGPL